MPEIRAMNTMHDDVPISTRWDAELFNKSISPTVYANKTSAAFLDKAKRMATMLFDNVGPLKNLKNYIVDKYHWDAGR